MRLYVYYPDIYMVYPSLSTFFCMPPRVETYVYALVIYNDLIFILMGEIWRY